MQQLIQYKVLMLKTNSKTKKLVVATIVVWIAVGIMLFKSLNANDDNLLQQNEVEIAFTTIKPTVIDTFSIQTMDKDPFLGLVLLKKKKPSKLNLKKPIKSNFNWPVTYHGVIKNQNTRTIYVVKIKGTEYLLKKGQTVDSITLLKGTDKYLVVGYKNSNKRIDRTE